MSNTLEMLKKAPVTSSRGLQSKDLYISCAIEKSRHSHESEGLKLEWFFQGKLFSLRNSNIGILSNIFPLKGSRDIGLWLSIFFLSSFFMKNIFINQTKYDHCQ